MKEQYLIGLTDTTNGLSRGTDKPYLTVKLKGSDVNSHPYMFKNPQAIESKPTHAQTHIFRLFFRINFCIRWPPAVSKNSSS